jgi:ABC-2 type transport system permease protein
VNLLNAELRRLFARRFTRLMLVVVLLVMAAVAVGTAVNSHRHDAAALARAQAQVDQLRQQSAQEQQRCEDEQANPPSDASQRRFPPDFDCAQLGAWIPEADNFLPYEFNFRKDAPQMILVLGGLLTLFGFAVGASFVGAEWNSGGMMNLLLWRPRRLPTLLGKLSALLVGLTVAAIGYTAIWVGALWGVASARGSTAQMTAGVWRSLGLDSARALVLGLCAACVGFAIASLGRHTATALGIAVGYLVVFEIGVRIVLGAARVHRPERFLLSNYVAAWLTKAQWFYDWHYCDTRAGACEAPRWAIHLNQGLLALGAMVLVTVVAAFWTMRRRDIT